MGRMGLLTVAAVTTCACGDPDCCLFALAYPFCPGCGDHHRAPVGYACPVEISAFRWHVERVVELCGAHPLRHTL